MNNQQRRLLPSTSMLQAFTAAARSGSFTAAAKELNLTQGAVSRQVHALEKQLGVALFTRTGKTVQLTDNAKDYAKSVQESLNQIRNASLNVIANPLSGVLNLAILPTFGTRWLMPRFPDFLKQHPDITVNFVSRLSPFDFKEDNIHASIHYGAADWPDASSTYLMQEKVVPVCSPKFLKQELINTPEQLQNMPLLELASRPNAWDEWLAEIGVVNETNPSKQSRPQGMVFEQISILAQAAMVGIGIALLPKFLIESELQRGELVCLFEQPVNNRRGYYLVTAKDKAQYAPVVAFKNWLLAQIKS